MIDEDNYDVFNDIDCNFADNNSQSFNMVFGDFKPKAIVEPTYKPSVINHITDGRANPCNDCGEYPRTHDVCFKDKDGHKKHIYIDCETCSNCDGEWYETEDEAIEAWNKANPLKEVERNEEKRKAKEFIREVMETNKLDY